MGHLSMEDSATHSSLDSAFKHDGTGRLSRRNVFVSFGSVSLGRKMSRWEIGLSPRLGRSRDWCRLWCRQHDHFMLLQLLLMLFLGSSLPLWPIMEWMSTVRQAVSLYTTHAAVTHCIARVVTRRLRCCVVCLGPFRPIWNLESGSAAKSRSGPWAVGTPHGPDLSQSHGV